MTRVAVVTVLPRRQAGYVQRLCPQVFFERTRTATRLVGLGVAERLLVLHDDDQVLVGAHHAVLLHDDAGLTVVRVLTDGPSSERRAPRVLVGAVVVDVVVGLSVHLPAGTGSGVCG